MVLMKTVEEKNLEIEVSVEGVGAGIPTGLEKQSEDLQIGKGTERLDQIQFSSHPGNPQFSSSCFNVLNMAEL